MRLRLNLGLKGKITEITEALRKKGQVRLASCIEENWDKTCIDYSRELNTYSPDRDIEPALLKAFETELKRINFHDPHDLKDILSSLSKRRIIQTAPHLAVTNTPRVLCINWLGSLAVEKKDIYMVGMFSGVPFSNRMRPGRINRRTDSINLFPSTMQDALVYRSKIDKKIHEAIEKVPIEILRFFPKENVGTSYTQWAIESNQLIGHRILRKRNLIYLDINEVISAYLLEVLKNKDHVLYKIFFNPSARAEFDKAFPEEIIFYTPAIDRKYEVMENMSFSGGEIKSKSKTISLEDPEILIKEIRDNRLCPALVISFLVLAFINRFKCFGSFAQVEYLPVYQEKFAKLSFMKEFNIESVPTSNLTTGTFPKKHDYYPVDIIMSQKKWQPDPSMLFGEIILPMKDVLLEGYFTGDTRKKNDKKK